MDAKQSVSADPEPAERPLAELRPQRPPGSLHRPLRALIAAAELAAVVALGFAVVWAWRRATIPYELPVDDNPAVPRTVDRWSGPWVGAAFGLAALAGVLALDALRQLVLAVRTRTSRPRPAPDLDPDE
jgi:hypothetical protein